MSNPEIDVPSNPDEHPGESAVAREPLTSLQSVIDVHLDAIAEQFKRLGKPPLCIAITARCHDEIDTAGNDVVQGFHVAEGHDEGDTIVSTAARSLRALRRVYADAREEGK